MTTDQIKKAIKITRDSIEAMLNPDSTYQQRNDAVCRLLEVKSELKTAAVLCETDSSALLLFIERVAFAWCESETVIMPGVDEAQATLARLAMAVGFDEVLLTVKPKSLNETEQRALDIIRKEGPIDGKTLAGKLSVEQEHLRGKIIPALKPHGVFNPRDGTGYLFRKTM